jgi:hypothetical protein
MVETLLREPATPSLAAVWDTYGRLALREELAGRLPTGLFRQAEQATHQTILHGWLLELNGFAGDTVFRRGVTRFGQAGAGAPGGAAGWLGRDGAGEGHPAIRLEIPGHGAAGRPLAVELVGRTDLVLTPEEGIPSSVTLSCGRNEQRDKDRLRGFLDHLALSAAQLSSGAHGAVTIWARNGKHALRPALFRAVSPERARAYLAGVVAAMLAGTRDAAGRSTGVHDYLLPIEAVIGAVRKGRSVVDEVEQLRDNYLENPTFSSFSSVNGPVPEAVERHDPPAPEDGARMVAERFGLYFDLLDESGS